MSLMMDSAWSWPLMPFSYTAYMSYSTSSESTILLSIFAFVCCLSVSASLS